MNRSVLLALYDQDQRIDIIHPGLFKEIAGGVVRFLGSPDQPGSNFIGYCRLPEDRLDRAIKEQISFYSRLGFPFGWRVYDHDSPPDLRVRLLHQGFNLGHRDAVMVMDLSKKPAPIFLGNDVLIRKITETGQIEEMIQLLRDVWQMDFCSLQELLLQDLWKRPDFSSIYLAYVDGIPAATAWIRFPENSQFATIWGGTTKPAYRGRGLYKALMGARIQEAIRRGYSFIAAEISQKSKDITEANGFQLLTYTHTCYWEPA